MVRSQWIGVLAGVLSFLTLASAGDFLQPRQVVAIKEAGKPARQCKVLRCWKEKDGTGVCEVQALDNGEKMTMLQPVATGSAPKPAPRIFSWGRSKTPPPGLPATPPSGLASNNLVKGTTGTAIPARSMDPVGKIETWSAATPRRAQTASTQPVQTVAAAPHSPVKQLPELFVAGKPTPMPTAKPGTAPCRNTPCKLTLWERMTSRRTVCQPTPVVKGSTCCTTPAAQAGSTSPHAPVKQLPKPPVVIKPVPAAAVTSAPASCCNTPCKPTLWERMTAKRAGDQTAATQFTAPSGKADPSAPHTGVKALPDPLAHPERYTRLPFTSVNEPSQSSKAATVADAKKSDCGCSDAPAKPRLLDRMASRLATEKPVARPAVASTREKPATSKPSLMGRMAAIEPTSKPAKGSSWNPFAKKPAGVASKQAKAKQEEQLVRSVLPNGMPVVSLPVRPGMNGVGVPSNAPNAFSPPNHPADMNTPFPGPGAFAQRPWGPRPPMPPPGSEAALVMNHQAMMAQYQAQVMRNRGPMAPPAMQPMMPPRAMMPASGPQPQRVAPQLLAILRSAPLPSQREMAADGLRRIDWKSEGEVVPGLLAAIQHDPAPMVRATSIRVLGQLKANTLPVVEALEQARRDADPRVRTQATETIALLGVR